MIDLKEITPAKFDVKLITAHKRLTAVPAAWGKLCTYQAHAEH